MLEIKNLKKTFDSGTEALNGVNLKVKKGIFIDTWTEWIWKNYLIKKH